MNDLTARLSSHDDPRLYREADELMQEAAAEITCLHVELDRIRSDRDCEKRLRKDAEEAREVLTAELAALHDFCKQHEDSLLANEADISSARAAALEEAAVICAKLEWPGRNHSEYIQGQNDMSYKCAIVIRAAITKGSQP